MLKNAIFCSVELKFALQHQDVEQQRQQILLAIEGVATAADSLHGKASIFAARAASVATDALFGPDKAREAAAASTAARDTDEMAQWTGQVLRYFIRAAQSDAEQLKRKNFESIFRSPLWSEGSSPVHALWESVEEGILQTDPNWNFWREWFCGFLHGAPLDWELQRRVSQIEDPIWEAGLEEVATEIDQIKAEMLSERLPMAETIELSPASGRFHAVPVPVENTQLMSALLSQIEDAMEDCIGSHNGLAQQSGDVKKLNRVLSKYRDNPQNAELTLTRVASSLRTQLHDSRELPDNEDNLALLNAVEEGVRGIRANHPEVAANREQLAQQAFKALSTEDKQLLENALPLLEEISEPELAEDFAADIPELINDALRPLPDGARPLPGADAATRVFSRVSKMALACEKSAKTFDSKEVKTIQLAHLGYTCLEFLYALVQVGLKALGVV